MGNFFSIDVSQANPILVSRIHFVAGMVLVIAILPFIGLSASGNPSDGIDFFENQVRPVLVDHCYKCHSQQAGEVNGELRLDSRSAMLKGGTRGELLSVPSPDRSLLIRAIEYRDPEIQMPPDEKMPDAQIDLLRRWIEMGAPDPREELAPTSVSSFDDQLKRGLDHWAYQPLHSPDFSLTTKEARSSNASDDWSRDSLDSHVFEFLAKQGLRPSIEADRRELVRRLYFDLIGLPPSMIEIQRWVDDPSQEWYPKLVDELLASPHFGERMSRRWMDIVRYADNKGYVFQEEREYPHAYRYRDWLIRSFNADLPYRDFVRYQLIGDQLDSENQSGNLDAMGMLTLGRRFLQNKHDIIDDRIDVVSRGLLGVTASCARCHDHKFDPVSTADYYSLHGMFSDSEEPGGDPSPMRLVDKPKTSETFVFLRGNSGNRGPKIDRRFFSFLDKNSESSIESGSGRRELAEEIVAPSHPLTARVYVNRVWGWITGRSIVDTPSDFGLRCEPPVYQSILDELAWDFIEHDWSTKSLIKRIVLSATYRQSSLSNPSALEKDPENRWHWRANRRRMDFEAYRDAMLLSIGGLDASIGGKSVVIHTGPFVPRRTVYAYIDRQNLHPLFRSFDFASPDTHSPQRPQTTVPQQGLALMNSDWMLDLLRQLQSEIDSPAQKPEKSTKTKSDAARQIDWLFERILARRPTQLEKERALEFLRQCDEKMIRNPENCWTYGYGAWDEEVDRLQKFETLPKFEKGQWTGRNGFPDSELGWTMLNEKGGHPGGSFERCVIRRWTAPRTGTIIIRGTLEHPVEEGDGIRAWISHNGSRILGSWSVKKDKLPIPVQTIFVQTDDRIDFIVDCLENETSDAFSWSTVLQYKDSAEKYDSKSDFSGMQPTVASALQQLAQALLMTNEFCFVD